MCSLDCKYLEELKVHMQSIQWKCQKCDEEFEDMCDLMNHKVECQSSDPELFCYGFCIWN